MSKGLFASGATQHGISRFTSTRNSYKVYPGIGESSPNPYKNFREPFRDAQDRILDLRPFWERQADAESVSAVEETAISWIEDMYMSALKTNNIWIDPHVSADPYGNIVFEWWKGEKKLTIYVSPDTKEYVKVWGPDIFSEMEDGDIEKEDSQALWRWLTD
jgi:hypothetical protein